MLPLKAKSLKLADRWPKRIILHHTACKLNRDDVNIDNTNLQSYKFHVLNYQLRNETETGFHFIIEKFKDDYQVVVSQPLLTTCEFDDINPVYWKDIHIAFFGNYDNDIPKDRLYKILAHRLLSPLMRLFKISENDIVFHSTISEDPTSNCPGNFIDMERVLMHLRSFHIKRGVTRG